MDVYEAIRASIVTGTIQSIPWSSESHEYLILNCDDSVLNDRVFEFWNEGDGEEWRVHLEAPDMEDEFECPRCSEMVKVADVMKSTYGDCCPKCGFEPHPAHEAVCVFNR